MQCSFCDNPAAHPAAGCVYGPNTIACYYCTRDFFAWVVRHTNGKSRRARVKTGRAGISFYEAAGKKP